MSFAPVILMLCVSGGQPSCAAEAWLPALYETKAACEGRLSADVRAYLIRAGRDARWNDVACREVPAFAMEQAE